ncbi:MAG TPA: MXAN_2562 family outer membrane beta-barrel protein [Polyangia bacterium]|nr:MXAN_2562 family outer membrane beta-barrel protein [Polyangia bacterium]
MKRPLLIAGALALLAVSARPARAQSPFGSEAEIIEDEPSHAYKSPQRFAFELTFGPYRPDVDSEFNGARAPYNQYFGGGHDLLTRVEFDYQIWHRYGSIAAGLGVGYFSVTGTAPVASGTGMLSGDQSELKVIPISLSAVYRFDYLMETYKVPLVPFGKLGLDWAYWQITDGNGNIADADSGGRGRGGTLGWHVAGGLALVLDFLDPEAAHDFDQDLGVNHTALTFEFFHSDLSGLGQANRLHVGDNDWTLGLLIEF